MLDQRRRRWANIEPALVQRLVFAGTGLGHNTVAASRLLSRYCPQNEESDVKQHHSAHSGPKRPVMCQHWPSACGVVISVIFSPPVTPVCTRPRRQLALSRPTPPRPAGFHPPPPRTGSVCTGICLEPGSILSSCGETSAQRRHSAGATSETLTRHWGGVAILLLDAQSKSGWVHHHLRRQEKACDVNTRLWPNAGSMLVHRLRRWSNNKINVGSWFTWINK